MSLDDDWFCDTMGFLEDLGKEGTALNLRKYVARLKEERDAAKLLAESYRKRCAESDKLVFDMAKELRDKRIEIAELEAEVERQINLRTN